MDATTGPGNGNSDVVSWTPEVEELLRNWHRRMYASQHAYYTEAERFRRWHFWLGVPAVILSSVVGTTVFATLQKQELGIPFRVAIALVSIAAAVFSGLQTFLRLAETASAHGVAADWYSAIRRDIEEVQALPCAERGHSKAYLDTLRKEINKAVQKSPELRESLWTEVTERFGIDEPPGARKGP
jgi:hypothetical protein